jgi:hypothetical protein
MQDRKQDKKHMCCWASSRAEQNATTSHTWQTIVPLATTSRTRCAVLAPLGQHSRHMTPVTATSQKLDGFNTFASDQLFQQHRVFVSDHRISRRATCLLRVPEATAANS